MGILVAIGSDEVDLDALQVCLDGHDKKKKRCNNDNEDEDSTIAATRKQRFAFLQHYYKINCSCEGICLGASYVNNYKLFVSLIRQQEEQNISFSTRRSAFPININLQMHPLSPL